MALQKITIKAFLPLFMLFSFPPAVSAKKFAVAFGGACEQSSDCTAAFSVCTAKKCDCMEGTRKSGTTCLPKVRRCPSGEPLVDSNKRLVICNPTPYDHMRLTYSPTAYSADERIVEAPRHGTCPANFVCTSEGGIYEEEIAYGSVRGFCCPVPARCPIGEPDRNKTCSYEYSELEFCPHETHYCFTSSHVRYGGKICCPKPCPEGSIHRNGTCERHSNVGEPCESNLQCVAGSSGECINGKCACGKGLAVSPKDGLCFRPSCPFTFKPLAPVKTANGDFILCVNSSMCPENSICASGDNVCCPKPAPVCNASEVIPRKDVEPCALGTFGSPPKPCPDGKYCRSLYTEPNPNATTFKESGSLPEVNHGVCCNE